MSTTEAATRLGVRSRTLYRMIDLGELPAYRLGRVIRIKAVDVGAYIDSCRIQPGQLRHLYPDTAIAS